MNAQEDIAIAEAIIAGIKELLALYESHKSGTVSASDALAAAQAITDSIAANRKAGQDALDARFPK